jgi:hypothetical protein
MNKGLHLKCFFCALVALAVVSPVFAHPGGITTPDPTLPPDGVYLSPFDVHATYGDAALMIVLSAVQHQPFAGQDPTYFQCDSTGVPGGTCEHHEFESGLEADFEVLMNGNPVQSGQIHMSGPVKTNALGKGPGDVTGSWPTEMVSMQLTGLGGASNIMVRAGSELGLPPTLGLTTITDVGGGMYHIDSFFDVFTELSMDGGQTWIPSNGPTHVILGIPEPTSIVLVGLALVGLAGLTRRRK